MERPVVGVALTETTDTPLKFIPVRIHGPKGAREVVTPLDSGSQTSLCCKDVLKVIGVAGKGEGLQLQNIEGSGPRQSSLSVQLTVSALGADAKKGHIVV